MISYCLYDALSLVSRHHDYADVNGPHIYYLLLGLPLRSRLLVILSQSFSMNSVYDKNCTPSSKAQVDFSDLFACTPSPTSRTEHHFILPSDIPEKYMIGNCTPSSPKVQADFSDLSVCTPASRTPEHHFTLPSDISERYYMIGNQEEYYQCYGYPTQVWCRIPSPCPGQADTKVRIMNFCNIILTHVYAVGPKLRLLS